MRAFLLPVFFFCLFSCSKDDEAIECDGSNLTYNSGISSIINSNCNASGCHGNASSNGDFTSYANLQGVINNGRFNNRVLITKDMPQGSSLTDGQLSQIKCWADNGFPEN